MVPAMGSPTAEGVRVVGRRYRLIDKVGAGGMGTVWRAHDELLGRTVAVKEVCLPQVGGIDRAELRARTMREARAAARLSHPNAVTVHDMIEEDGQPWIVMALVSADSLSDVLATSGALPPKRVAEIGLALLSALEAAHAAGILHRDVKTANVLLGHDGRVVLTDFGVATLEGDPALTGTGMLLGSPAYMAPERALGAPVGPGSDLWSLGATLYAAVEGQPPFDRTTPMATLAALATEDAPAPRAAGPLTAVLTGLLVRDPKLRLDIPATRRMLQAAAGDPAAPQPSVAWQTVNTRSTAAWVQPAPPRRRRPRLRAAVLGGLALAVVVAIVATALIVNSGRQTPSIVAPGQSSAPAAKPSPSAAGPSLAAVPAGFGTYYDSAGWSITKPVAWHSVFATGGQEQKFSDDFAGLHLFVYKFTPPLQDPLSLQQTYDQTLENSAYHRIFLGAVKYRGYTAADFEFTEDPAGPATTNHVRSRIFTVGSMQYEIRLDLPADRWNLRYFTVATDTFQPPA